MARNNQQLSSFDDPFFTETPSRPMYFSRYFSNPLDTSLSHHFGSGLRRTRNDRFAEMDKKYDDFVSKVDDRFTGILSRIDSDPFNQTRIPVDIDGRDKSTTVAVTPKKYDLSVSVQDFKPEEVSVKVRGDQVMIHAKRENKNEGDGMYAYSLREFKRSFTIPDNVKSEFLTSTLTTDGILKIEAPVKDTKSIAAANTDVNIKVDHGRKA